MTMVPTDVRDAQVLPATLDRLLPEYEFADTIALPVLASPERLFRAFREVTLRDMPLSALLGNLRYLPGRLLRRRPEAHAPDLPFVRQLLEAGTVVLSEEPGREIVLGTIGKFHRIVDQKLVFLRRAEDFHRFDDPAYQKLVMAVRVEQDRRGRRLVLEHRTHGLGPESRRAFARYWVAIRPMGHVVSWLLLRAVRHRAARRR